ncbi:MAG: hypothetical protein ACYC41_09555 [Bacillota bacterium]
MPDQFLSAPPDLGPQPIALPIAVDARRVAACLGSAERVAAHPTLAAAVEEAMAEARPILRPVAVCAVVAPGEAPLPHPPEAGWTAVEWVVPFAATIGPAVELAAVAAAGEGKLVRAMALDAVASAACLTLTDSLIHHLTTGPAAAAGFEAVSVAFPGDEDYPLEHQSRLVNLLPPPALATAGLAVQTSGALSPVKAVAGVIGLSRAGAGADAGTTADADAGAGGPSLIGRRACARCPIRGRCPFAS